jgi:hypothetical protein
MIKTYIAGVYVRCALQDTNETEAIIAEDRESNQRDLLESIYIGGLPFKAMLM